MNLIFMHVLMMYHTSNVMHVKQNPAHNKLTTHKSCFALLYEILDKKQFRYFHSCIKLL